MASVVDVVFLVSFLVFVGLWFFQLYDILTGMAKYEASTMWLVLVGLFLSYGVSFITVLNVDYTVFNSTLFSLQTLLYYLVYLFLFIRLFGYISSKVTGERKAFKSLGDR